jgi:hypothetical protein
MSNSFSPTTVQSLVNKAKLLAVSFAPQGTGAPKLVSGNGAATVTRNSAGNFTVALQNQFVALVDAQVSLQLAAGPTSTPAAVTVGTGTAAITVTAGTANGGAAGNLLALTVVQSVQASLVFNDTTDSDTVTFTASTGFVGVAGNNLQVAVVVGVALANSIAVSDGITTVTLTTAATTTPAELVTYVNTTAVATLGTYITAASTGTTIISTGLTATPLTGGVGFNTTTTVTQVGNLLTIFLPVGGATAAQAETAFNAQIPSTFAIATLPGSGAGTLLVASQTSFTGGVAGVLVASFAGINVTSAGTGAQTCTVVVQNAATGAATDITSHVGNLVNIELTLKDAVD